MPTVSIGTTDKRINSTKQTFSSVFSADCKLKEPCSMESPVFIVQGLSKGSFYNYCQFEGRYFWIDDIVYQTRDIQEVHCHIDPLSTYKDDIKNTFAYVQYGDKAHWNKWVDDCRINPEKEDTTLSTSEKVTCINASETGCVIMRVMDSGNGGGVKTIAVTPNSFDQMLTDLYNVLSPLTLEKIAGMVGGIGSWRDNILDCYWVPFNLATGGANQVRIGNVPCDFDGSYINPILQQIQHGTWSLDWTYANDHPYLKHSRWTTVQVVTPFGYCELPLDVIVNAYTIYVTTSVVKTSGDITISIYDEGYGEGTLLASFSGNVSVNLMGMLGSGKGLGFQLANGVKVGANLGATAATLGMTMGAGSVSVNQAQRQFNDAVSAAKPNTDRISYAYDRLESAKVDSKISNFNAGLSIASALPNTTGAGSPSGSIGGGLASLWVSEDFCKAILTKKVFVPVDKAGYGNFCDMYGYPVNAYWSLSTFSGFVKCSGASVPATGASPASLATLNSMVNSGIFIE